MIWHFNRVTENQPLFTKEMSVRTEPRDLSQQLQQTLTIPGDVMLHATNQQVGAQPAMDGIAPSDHALAAANDFNTSSPEHPLKRTVVINIRSSLSDLCLRGARDLVAALGRGDQGHLPAGTVPSHL